MFKHILLATDGSAASDHATTQAIALARVHGSTITAVFVSDPYPYLGIGETNPVGFESYMAAAQQYAAAAHAKVSQLCNEGGPAVPLEVRLVENAAAAEGIVGTAKTEGADLIVIGSHGRNGLGRLMLGSVADKVVHKAEIPVLVVR